MRKLFILLILSIVFASFTGCNIKKGKNQNEEIADQVNEALSDHNTDLVRDLLTNKLKETESDDLKNLVNFVSGDISEVGELSTANTCEWQKWHVPIWTLLCGTRRWGLPASWYRQWIS